MGIISIIQESYGKVNCNERKNTVYCEHKKVEECGI